MNCDETLAAHFHYWYWLRLPRDEAYVKNPVAYMDRKAAGRAGARDASRVMVLKCDGPSGQGAAG